MALNEVRRGGELGRGSVCVDVMPPILPLSDGGCSGVHPTVHTRYKGEVAESICTICISRMASYAKGPLDSPIEEID